MLTIIACWIFLFIVVILVGKLFLNAKLLSSLKIEGNFEWYEHFWAGLFIVFGILQIWSIFLPVNIYSMLFVVFLAIVSLIILLRKGIVLPKKINFGFVAICFVGLLIISYYATQVPYMSDTVGYHLNAVKWTNLYPVTPGLANLHSRLGFNTSFFTFASMLNNWFMRDKVSHLALSFLVAGLFVEFVWIILKSKQRHLKFFCLLIAPAIIGKVVNSEMISSLYYDFALIIFVVVACIEFIRGSKQSLIIAALISLLIPTIKLSGVCFSFLILLFITYKFVLANKSIRLRYLAGLSLSGLFVLVPYFVRNAILSGWLLYPFPILKMNFDWAVPTARVERIYTVIQTWAKVPGVEWSKYINSGFWDWFPLWYGRNSEAVGLVSFALALILVSTFLLFRKNMKNVLTSKMFYLGLASLSSFLYILFTAPDLRFGGIFIWIFFACSVGAYLSNLNWNNNFRLLFSFLFLIFIFKFVWPIRLDTEPYLKSIRWDQASPTENVNGILMPTEDGCGNSGLPCTPESNNIKWRVPGDLSKGFAPVE